MYRREAPLGRHDFWEVSRLLGSYDETKTRLAAFCEEPELELMVMVRREGPGKPRDECYPSPEVCRTINGICREFLLSEMEVYRGKLVELGLDPEAP